MVPWRPPPQQQPSPPPARGHADDLDVLHVRPRVARDRLDDALQSLVGDLGGLPAIVLEFLPGSLHDLLHKPTSKQKLRQLPERARHHERARPVEVLVGGGGHGIVADRGRRQALGVRGSTSPSLCYAVASARENITKFSRKPDNLRKVCQVK